MAIDVAPPPSGISPDPLVGHAMDRRDIERIQDREGWNILRMQITSWWMHILYAPFHPMNIDLVLFAVMALFLEEYQVFLFIMIFILLSSFLNIIGDLMCHCMKIISNKIFRQLEAGDLQITTIRYLPSQRKNVENLMTPGSALVVGDLIRLKPGNLVPADVRIFIAKKLEMLCVNYGFNENTRSISRRVGQLGNWIEEDIEEEEEEEEKETVNPLVKAFRRIFGRNDDDGSQAALPMDERPRGNLNDDEDIMMAMGSAVVSGTAVCKVVATGENTQLGSVMSRHRTDKLTDKTEKGFMHKMNVAIGLIFVLMLVAVTIAQTIIGFRLGTWEEALFFMIPFCVAITPKSLPSMVSIGLGKAALKLKWMCKTVVRELDTIVDLAGVDTLVMGGTTGVLTTDSLVLREVVIDQEFCSHVPLFLGYINAYFQSAKVNRNIHSEIEKYFEQNFPKAKVMTIAQLDVARPLPPLPDSGPPQLQSEPEPEEETEPQPGTSTSTQALGDGELVPQEEIQGEPQPQEEAPELEPEQEAPAEQQPRPQQQPRQRGRAPIPVPIPLPPIMRAFQFREPPPTPLETFDIFYEIELVHENPFDFNRRCCSVIVKKRNSTHSDYLLVCSGAVEEILLKCWDVLCPKDPIHARDNPPKNFMYAFLQEGTLATRTMTHRDMECYKELHENYSNEGRKVVCVAYKRIPRSSDELTRAEFGLDDESRMTLAGFLVFDDTTRNENFHQVDLLQTHGVKVKLLTGETPVYAQYLFRKLKVSHSFTIAGEDVTRQEYIPPYPPTETPIEYVARRATEFNILAKVNPVQKKEIVKGLQEVKKKQVAYIGKCTSDLNAMTQAHVAITHCEAPPSCLNFADMVVPKDGILKSVAASIIMSRTAYLNTLKFVILSLGYMLGLCLTFFMTSVWLNFEPVTPLQLLFHCLCCELLHLSIFFDKVEKEYQRRPQRYSVGDVFHYILMVGVSSAVVGLSIYVFMIHKFKTGSGNLIKTDYMTEEHLILLRSAWFTGSLLYQGLVPHIIRTWKISFIQSFASGPVMIATFAVAQIAISLPIIPGWNEWIGLKILTMEAYGFICAVLTGIFVLVGIMKVNCSNLNKERIRQRARSME